MNVLLWILQAALAFMCGAGSLWRFFNYAEQAKSLPSLQALPYAAWNAIGVVEIVCAVGLILPGLLGLKGLTAIAASILAVELLLVTALHLKYFGLTFQATNPAVWSLGMALVAAFIAYGRFAARPL